ncbi:MAG: DUF362 domain-containing protein [Acidobacteria bacterium]|nr:DUF362 domain-containing protein [Acidobacteriota bacterium]
MALTRRELLQSGGLAAAGLLSGLDLKASTARIPQDYFAVHPFVEANPKAVFIKRTNVPDKFATEAKRREGLALAREVFVTSDKPGIPVSHRIILKPNFTSVRQKGKPDGDFLGTGTDSDFYEGMLLGLKELGLKKFHFLEANQYNSWNYRGFLDINERHGVEMNETDRRVRHFRDDFEMTWSKVPDAVVYARIPHYAPVNEPDTWLLNMAKWKAHGMCMTLSVKNVQGLVVKPFVRFCPGWKGVTGVEEFMKPDIAKNAEQRIQRYFDSHVRMQYSRYDSTAALAPINQEIWAHKTCDNHSVLNPGLNIIEGIFGRDGDGFGTGQDYMTNLIMFSKDKFRLDAIGMYLGGHEPGNVNLFRVAKERGLTDTFNPWEIPVYEWKDGVGVERKLSDFTRTPLKTYYLQRAGEPLYHLVNEPFDYDRYRV